MDDTNKTPSETTVDLLKQLAWSRSMIEQGRVWLDDVQKALEQTPEFLKIQELREEQRLYQERADRCYEALTTWAETEYATTQEKHPISGVEIKMVLEVNVTDEKQAKLWASMNAPATLTLNMTKFKPICKSLELPFVEVKESPKAYIATDLSAYLPK